MIILADEIFSIVIDSLSFILLYFVRFWSLIIIILFRFLCISIFWFLSSLFVSLSLSILIIFIRLILINLCFDTLSILQVGLRGKSFLFLSPLHAIFYFLMVVCSKSSLSNYSSLNNLLLIWSFLSLLSIRSSLL